MKPAAYLSYEYKTEIQILIKSMVLFIFLYRSVQFLLFLTINSIQEINNSNTLWI